MGLLNDDIDDEVVRLYGDIIDLPHHVSKNHKPMSMMARAAQFAPFAALTGYESIIKKVDDEHDGSSDE